MRISEMVVHAEIGLLHVRPGVERYVSVHLELQTWRRQHSIEHPLACHFPANAGGGDNRILPFDIDTDAEDNLQIRAVDVGAANDERQVEIVRQIVQPRVIHTGLSFDSDQD